VFFVFLFYTSTDFIQLLPSLDPSVNMPPKKKSASSKASTNTPYAIHPSSPLFSFLLKINPFPHYTSRRPRGRPPGKKAAKSMEFIDDEA
jgi:hypothetical protein